MVCPLLMPALARERSKSLAARQIPGEAAMLEKKPRLRTPQLMQKNAACCARRTVEYMNLYSTLRCLNTSKLSIKLRAARTEELPGHDIPWGI
jgi:hypothetical protein